MAQKFELRRGFLRLQRLGPIKFGEQSRWSVRAPESTGLWAFPYPHFDLFYGYHRYTDLLPKSLRGNRPQDPKWWRRTRLEGEDAYAGGYAVASERDEGDYPVESWDEIVWDGDGFPVGFYVISEYYRARDGWIETVGKKVLPLREFWYRGELYSHFLEDGTIGGWTPDAAGEGNDWTLMSTDRFSALLKKPGSVIAVEGHDGGGKPQPYRFSTDHLEVFIPRGRGEIRDRI